MINLQKSKAASTELNKRNYNVVFVTEPNSSHGRVKLLDSTYGSVHHGQGKPRAALRVDRKLHPWDVTEFTDEDMCTVAIKVEGKVTYVCSLYLDILFDVKKPLLVNLIDACKTRRIPLVIGMDSNSHSPLWGCEEANQRGRDLEDLITSKNLIVTNVGSTPTFVRHNAETLIDVTLMNAYASANLTMTDWEVETDKPSFSDHRYIKFSLGKYEPTERSFRNLKKADWDRFRLALEAKNPPLLKTDGSNIDECADQLELDIREAFDEACPERVALDRKPNPWWTPELSTIREELQNMSKVAKSNPERWAAYKALLKTYNKEIRKAKRESWRNFCTKAESAKDISKVVRALKPKSTRSIGLITSQGISLSPQETLANLMDTHFPDSLASGEEEWDKATANPISDQAEVCNNTKEVVSYITLNKVKASIRTFGPKKAAGPDGFSPIVLQNLSQGYLNLVTLLYKMAVLTGYTPRAWRKMKVVFIPKSGKTDYGQAKSYRPITLSNFLLKGLERIMQWYITEQIVPEPLVSQHAYTAGRSTETALSDAVDYIERSISRGEHALAVSLDCSGAFDRIKFESAAKAMQTKRIPKCISDWYNTILSNRLVTADVQGEQTARIPKRGSPQGGVLSPLIWNLIMDTLLVKFQNAGIKVVCYADDVLLIITGKDPGSLVELMQKALRKVTKWGEENGLFFNPTKTCATIFTKSKRRITWKKLKMGGIELSYSDTMKYLGVTLQKSLSWSQHIKGKVNQGVKILNLANAAVGQQWGFSPERTLWVYNALVKPTITYGSCVWANKLTKGQSVMLKKAQRHALMAMSSSMRSTPTSGMEVVLGLPPLDIHAKTLATLSRQRTRSTLKDTWDGLGNTSKGHRRTHDDILAEVIPRNYPIDQVRKHLEWICNDLVEEPEITLYTDGSKEEKVGAGWAVCHGDNVVADESVFLGTLTTVFQAEVIAIDRGLKWVNENCPDPTKIKIRTDSQAAMNAILSPITVSKVVKDCKGTIRAAQNSHKVELEWVKGHADNTGNELADMLAKSGNALPSQHTEPLVAVPVAHVKQKVNALYLEAWQHVWRTGKDCRQTKLFFETVEMRKLTRLSKWRREDLNLLIQAATGHALVGYHTNQWTNLGDTCELCLEDHESTAHLFYDCPALQWPRREAESSDKPLEEKILNFFSTKALKDLLHKRGQQCGDAGLAQL